MPNTVIVPLDGSKLSESAIPFAKQLASRTEASVLLVSIIPAPTELALWSHSAPEVAHEWVRRSTDVHHYLEETARRFEGIKTTTQVGVGNPVARIIDTANSVQRAVIVMASHGHTGFKRLMVGSVTAGVVHSTPCPVVVVRASETAGPHGESRSLDRLLVALDGSVFAEEALAVAREALGSSGLTFHLLRVAEISTLYMDGYESLDGRAFDAYMQWARDEAASYLEQMAAPLRAEGNAVTCQVEEGITAPSIIDAAVEHDVGLIVMATHGRTGLGRLLLGSVAERVLHQSPVPLLLVRPEKKGDGSS